MAAPEHLVLAETTALRREKHSGEMRSGGSRIGVKTKLSRHRKTLRRGGFFPWRVRKRWRNLGSVTSRRDRLQTAEARGREDVSGRSRRRSSPSGREAGAAGELPWWWAISPPSSLMWNGEQRQTHSAKTVLLLITGKRGCVCSVQALVGLRGSPLAD